MNQENVKKRKVLDSEELQEAEEEEEIAEKKEKLKEINEKKIESMYNPSQSINLSIQKIVFLNRHNNNNNLFFVETIANKGEYKKIFHYINMIGEVTIIPNKEMTNQKFVNASFGIFYEKSKNINDILKNETINSSLILLKKNKKFVIGPKKTCVLCLNKQKFLNSFQKVVRYAKNDTKKKKTNLDLSKYSLFFFFRFYYYSSDREELNSQLKFDEYKRINQGASTTITTKELTKSENNSIDLNIILSINN